MRSEDALASDLRIAVMRLNRCLRSQRVDSTRALHLLHQQTDTHPTLSQLSALSTVHLHGPLTPRALADLERVSAPSVTRTIVSLEAFGLLTRTPHPTDRRKVLLALSDLGADYIRFEVAAREKWLGRCLSELDATDQDTLRAAVALLDRLADTSTSSTSGTPGG